MYIMSITVFIIAGYRVSDTIRKGIIDVELYNGTESTLMVGNVAALTGNLTVPLVSPEHPSHYLPTLKNSK